MTQDQALDILKTGINVFLTGEPGSGKTHTVNRYVSYLREHDIAPSITASTGIAATHIGGMTIHSWSGIGIRKTATEKEMREITGNERVQKRIGAARILIIDEISMLDAETLTLVDQVCQAVKRNHLPFGGIQVVLVGDFFQLPPVITREETSNPELFSQPKDTNSRFCFTSDSWADADFVTCYLTEQHRHEDPIFLEILTALRSGNITESHRKHLRSRCIPLPANDCRPMTKLFPHNANADRINLAELEKLSTSEQVFQMQSEGPEPLVAQLKRGCLSPEILVLKKGAQVMFTKNNFESGFVNGTTGEVIDFDEDDLMPIIRTSEGRSITAQPMEWTIEDQGHTLAKITQLPLRLAWAITVHKSQGMSLDAAHMDLAGAFEYGQGYVALSRLRTLAGLHLDGFNERALQFHPQIRERDRDFRSASEKISATFTQKTPGGIRSVQMAFLKSCGGSTEIEKENDEVRRSVSRPPQSKEQRWKKTLEYFRQGKTIHEVAEIRGRTPGTILSHLEELAELEKLEPSDLTILSTDIQEVLTVAQPLFEDLGYDILTPVYEALRGKHDYETLRLARIILSSKKK